MGQLIGDVSGDGCAVAGHRGAPGRRRGPGAEVAPAPESPGCIGKVIQTLGQVLVAGDKETAAQAFNGGKVFLRVQVG